jgi:hypothetical protein
MRTHGSTSFVTMTINQLRALGFSDDEPFLASRVELQKRAARNFAQTFQVIPPKVEKEPEQPVEPFKFD